MTAPRVARREGMTFDDVRALDDRRLRELLAGDDAVLRLWAIWALAMRGATSTVIEHLGEEPSAGVRRHLAIVLAGAGEVDLLVALSRHDPEPGVRTTAAALVCRLAAGGMLPWSVALEAVCDPSPEVRKAVLRELAPAPHAAIEGPVLRALDDRDLEVRLEAVEVALRRPPNPEVVPRLVAWLVAAPTREARELLLRWSSVVGSPAVHAALVAAPPSIRVFAIRNLSAAWEDVALLAEDPDPEVRAAVQKSFWNRLGGVPMDVLATWLDRNGTWHSAAHAIAIRLARGEAVSPETLHMIRDQAERELAQIDAYLRKEGIDPERPLLPQLASEDTPELDWDRHELIEWFEAERAMLADLLARLDDPSNRSGDPSAPSDGQLFRM